jgi:hypothetical protein
LRGVIEREGAEMGVLVSLNSPTAPMVAEAAAAGFVAKSSHGRLPKLQVITAQDILSGRLPNLPPLPQLSLIPTRAPNAKKPRNSAQLEMLLPIGEVLPKPPKGEVVDPRFMDLTG